MKLLVDYDCLLYPAGFVGEERSIKAIHRESGWEGEFGNRTDFWGHYLKKAGGYLAEWNSGKKEENKRKPEEFDIIDIQEPKDISISIAKLKNDIEGLKEQTDCRTHYGYSGVGKSFREDVSTVVQYKGSRNNAIRPVHLPELRNYLVKYHGCTVVQGIEADDQCTMDSVTAWKKWKKTQSNEDKIVLAYQDKDFKGISGHIYNVNGQSEISSFDGFGKLFLNPKGEADGRGRVWFYYQILYGDDVDCYWANSGNPSMKWGERKAFDLLKDAKNDKEAWQILVDGYKTLYPSKKTIKGWRGEDIEIDWLYVLQENTTLAHMLRFEGDKIDVVQTLDKLGVEYE